MSHAITVEGLSKSYLLKHRSSDNPGYTTLRESLTHAASRGLRFLREGRTHPTSEELFWALRDVSFRVDEGERLAIIGRNGAGKSTLLKLLSRITDPSAGSIRIRGRLSSLLEVGTGFHPELSGRENIFLNGTVLGMSRSEVRKKFDAIVDFSEVERFLDTPVKRYSSGMYVKLAFAVSAFLDPDIIVLDEVLSVGDAAFQRKSQQKMLQLAENGRTVVFVSHSMGAVRSICNKGVVLNAGRMSEKMPVDDAIAYYLQNGAARDDAQFPVRTDEVELLDVQLMQYGGPCDEFDGEAPVEVRVRMNVLRALDEFRIGFYIKTNLGDTLLRALAADFDPKASRVEAAEYEVKCRIPANFLVEGHFLFELHCSRFGIRDYFDNKVSIPFRVRRSRSYNTLYPGEEPFGQVHLDPGWSTRKVSHG